MSASRADRFVSESNDNTIEPGGWTLALSDGSATVLVTTPEQLDQWLEATGTERAALEDDPIWDARPAGLR